MVLSLAQVGTCWVGIGDGWVEYFFLYFLFLDKWVQSSDYSKFNSEQLKISNKNHCKLTIEIIYF